MTCVGDGVAEEAVVDVMKEEGAVVDEVDAGTDELTALQLPKAELQPASQ